MSVRETCESPDLDPFVLQKCRDDIEKGLTVQVNLDVAEEWLRMQKDRICDERDRCLKEEKRKVEEEDDETLLIEDSDDTTEIETIGEADVFDIYGDTQDMYPGDNVDFRDTTSEVRKRRKTKS